MWSRNGPSRQRRRLRRAAARTASNAEEAKEATNEEMNTEEVTEITSEKERNIPPTEHEALKDEFCSDATFEEEIDEAKVEKILVVADCQADWKDDYVIKLVDEKLRMIGITMKRIIVNRNVRKCFESCLVTIEPMKRKLIEKETFPIRRWTMECIE